MASTPTGTAEPLAEAPCYLRNQGLGSPTGGSAGTPAPQRRGAPCAHHPEDSGRLAGGGHQVLEKDLVFLGVHLPQLRQRQVHHLKLVALREQVRDYEELEADTWTGGGRSLWVPNPGAKPALEPGPRREGCPPSPWGPTRCSHCQPSSQSREGGMGDWLRSRCFGHDSFCLPTVPGFSRYI